MEFYEFGKLSSVLKGVYVYKYAVKCTIADMHYILGIEAMTRSGTWTCIK